ncbi:hypothetical protein [Alterisphingorhabdus coralli]|uniref:J domain-containing protein n=1 Tax=Alterisphingorhabdus coralli TaxID=3071408 RepID=A0AA97I1F0_9SPHN|nr:hypothetical protein [Parasphingorhabdus sp. SCSIO 66989]WOE75225.1 hypothetical protein RB602_00460 [Parasphingorhabdus sp. SCSIO 66989]
MPLLFILAAGCLFWLWYSGRLARMQPGDWFALTVAMLGTRFLTTGQLPAAGAMLVGAIGWAVYRSASKPTAKAEQQGAPKAPPEPPHLAEPGMTIAEARMLLGIDERATSDMIRAAYRRRMTRAHPDAGGSAELAIRLGTARNILLENRTEKTDWPIG